MSFIGSRGDALDFGSLCSLQFPPALSAVAQLLTEWNGMPLVIVDRPFKSPTSSNQAPDCHLGTRPVSVSQDNGLIWHHIMHVILAEMPC